MNIKNIRPPECPDDAPLTAEEQQFIEVYQLIASATPDQLAKLIEMLEVAEALLAAGNDDDVIAQHLLNTYGGV